MNASFVNGKNALQVSAEAKNYQNNGSVVNLRKERTKSGVQQMETRM